MRSRLDFLLLCLLGTALCNPTFAQDNPEDEPLADEPIPTAPASPVPDAGNATPPADAPVAVPPTQAETAPVTPDTTTAAAAAASGDMVTIPRAVWEQLQRDVEELKRARATQPATGTVGAATTTSDTTATGADGTAAEGASADGTTTTAATGNRNYLLLPDISFVGQAKGLFSTDRRDEDRRRTGLAEGEIAIQGFVYPNVRAEAYLVGAPAEDEPVGFEEGFLTFLGVRKNLNVWLGRKFVPFGRTGEQHSHSWLYARQLLPFRNLVAEEALIGDGVGFRYTLPTGKLFTNLAVGYWTGEGAGEISSNPLGDITSGPGAGFDRRFLSARLWTGYALSQNSELELGGSYARGRSRINDDEENAVGRGNVTLTGLDLSYRLFRSGGKRLLLRTEFFGYRPDGFGGAVGKTSGYYGLLNYRFDPRKDIGLLFERSGFPQAPNQRETALSLIYTKQFTEQFYARLMGTRGDRPGEGSYNEARIQFTFGLGPHTHNLE
ncbi:MAG TPA: hypothetical protein VF600_18585 [Abditibacteriaceae bacterium]|jgi:hypothetical protein